MQSLTNAIRFLFRAWSRKKHEFRDYRKYTLPPPGTIAEKYLILTEFVTRTKNPNDAFKKVVLHPVGCHHFNRLIAYSYQCSRFARSIISKIMLRAARAQKIIMFWRGAARARNARAKIINILGLRETPARKYTATTWTIFDIFSKSFLAAMTFFLCVRSDTR